MNTNKIVHAILIALTSTTRSKVFRKLRYLDLDDQVWDDSLLRQVNAVLTRFEQTRNHFSDGTPQTISEPTRPSEDDMMSKPHPENVDLLRNSDKLARAVARVGVHHMSRVQKGVFDELPSVDELVTQGELELQRITVDRLSILATGDWEIELSNGGKASGRCDGEGFHHGGVILKTAKNLETYFGGLTPQ